MANVQPTSAGQSGSLHALRAHIQEIAVRFVMGDLDNAQRSALLTLICEEAQKAGREDVANIAIAALEAVSTRSMSDIDAYFSDCATSMQHILGESHDEVVPGEVSPPDAVS